MELNEKDKELIAKIDERLKHYKLITDNEQPITEQKERWHPVMGEQYYYITELFTVKSAIRENCMEDELRIVTAMNYFKTLQAATKAAQAIRETLKNL